MAMSSNVIWSTQAYKFIDFTSHFQLPQLVCVEDGFYDEKDETTLSQADILVLHTEKKDRFYKGLNKTGQDLNIPVNLEAKIQIISDAPIKTYESIEKLVENCTGRAVSVHSHPWLGIDAGDVMQVQQGYVSNRKGIEYIRFSFLSKRHDDIDIPMTYCAVFQVLPERLWLTEVEQRFKHFPVKIEFIDETLRITQEGMSLDTLQLTDLGEVTLQSVQENRVFIASVKHENRTMVLKIPVSMDITVKAGIGIVNGDYTYTQVCQRYHDRARLDQLDQIKFESIKIGVTETVVERIYEFVEELSDEENLHDYEDLAPKIPSRKNRKPLQEPKNDSVYTDSEDDERDDYEFMVQPNTKKPPHKPKNDSGSSDSEDDESDDYDQPGNNEPPPPPIPARIESLNKPRDSKGHSGTKICHRFRKVFQRKSGTSSQHVCEKAFESPSTQDARRYVADSTIPRGNKQFESTSVTEREFIIPNKLESLSEKEVCHCLRTLNMEQHVDTFHEQQINGSLLVTLTPGMLQSLGVNDKFQRTKLLKFIKG